MHSCMQPFCTLTVTSHHSMPRGCIQVVAQLTGLVYAVFAHGPIAWAGHGPVASGAIILAQVGRAQLQHCLRAPTDPELLASLHAAVYLLDRALHRGTAYRQTQPATVRLAHPLGVVAHIAHGLRQDLAGVLFRSIRRRGPAPRAGRPQLPQQGTHPTRPGPTQPAFVAPPRRLGPLALGRLRGTV